MTIKKVYRVKRDKSNFTKEVKQVVRKMAQKTKYDKEFTGSSTISVLTTGTVVTMTSGVQGDSYTNNYQGYVTNNKKLWLNLHFTGSNNANPSTLVRLIVFRYGTNNGIAPAVGELATNPVNIVPVDLTNKQDFTILSDRMIDVGNYGALQVYDVGVPIQKHLRITKKMKNHTTFNEANSAGATGIENGGIFFFVIGSTTGVSLTYNYRILFNDGLSL